MAKVTVNDGEGPNPLLAAHAKEVTVTDSRGRVLKIRKPALLAQYHLVEAVGSARAENSTLLRMIMPLMYLAAIDTDIIAPPTKWLEVEALIQRLDEDGMEALMKGAAENFGDGGDPEATRLALKNS